jgi:hypothetical protein
MTGRRFARRYAALVPLALALVFVFVAALLILTADPNGRATSAGTTSPAVSSSTGSTNTPTPERQALRTALSAGVARADALHGQAAAAVWVDGDPHPITSGPVMSPHRMWSTSKAVVAIAVLQTVRDLPDPMLRSVLEDAIVRSDNCAVRRAIVGLQDRLGKGIAGTEAAFEHVLLAAHARIESPPQTAAAERACVPYLQAHRAGLPRGEGDLGVVPEFGTAEWTEYDAISFAHSLSDGDYGVAGEYLLRLMMLPKGLPLDEGPAPPSAPPLDWGAGEVFPASWRPAWKAGWGGSRTHPPRFLAGQLVVLHIGRILVAAAAIFVPDTEPATDNPGVTDAPRALELIFGAVGEGLRVEWARGSQ